MIYVVYGILAVLILLIVVFGFGVMFLGRQTPEAPKVEVKEETKTGFFANETGAPNLVVGKAKLDSIRTPADFLGEKKVLPDLDAPSRNSLPVREGTKDDFKL